MKKLIAKILGITASLFTAVVVLIGCGQSTDKQLGNQTISWEDANTNAARGAIDIEKYPKE